MFAYDQFLEVPAGIDRDLEEKFARNKILEICSNISFKGDRTQYDEIYDLLFEHIIDNMEEYKENYI